MSLFPIDAGSTLLVKPTVTPARAPWPGFHFYPIPAAQGAIVDIGNPRQKNLSLTGSPVALPSKFGVGLKLDGSTQRAEGAAGDATAAYPQVIISQFMYTVLQTGVAFGISDAVNNGAAFGGFYNLVGNTTNIQLQIRVLVSGTVVSLSGPAHVINKLYTCVGVSRSATDHRLYVNGVKFTSTTNVGAWDGNVTRLNIGALRRGGDAASSFFPGFVYHALQGNTDFGDAFWLKYTLRPYQYLYAKMRRPWQVPSVPLIGGARDTLRALLERGGGNIGLSGGGLGLLRALQESGGGISNAPDIQPTTRGGRAWWGYESFDGSHRPWWYRDLADKARELERQRQIRIDLGILPKPAARKIAKLTKSVDQFIEEMPTPETANAYLAKASELADELELLIDQLQGDDDDEVIMSMSRFFFNQRAPVCQMH